MIRLAKIVIGAALAAYLAVLGLLYVYQRDLMYPRNPARAAMPGSNNLPGVEEAELTTADGERLVTWVVPPREGKPVLLFFHGNAGNFGRAVRMLRFRALTEDGTGLFAVNYRGYGGSTGTPTEAGLLLDARAAYAAASARFGAERLVGYGESLGTGVVLKLAAEQPLKAVILEGAYLSTASVAQLVYPFVPIALMMKDQFRSDEVIGRVHAPLLMLHGERDTVIPFAQGEALYALANPPKRFIRFPLGGHEDLPAHGSVPEIRRFLDDVAAGRLTGSEVRTVR
ncbi:alpha/beta hydrolase [Bosea caraganae]|uniref:Alpha/beta hydrolase n=1 Tax=Bosea caraganae TaxID=2763117 RepID=A0A370KXR1_9HYPH|nr:alpha/beta hydrolase [Bosea caraganae]RDJ19750.1 alpha/beta hydrolase [Bosea caraganae]RDJ21368.1 alpha/beta hydrolase [Bosea caraganae]